MLCDSSLISGTKTETKLLEFFRLATGELLKKCYGKIKCRSGSCLCKRKLVHCCPRSFVKGKDHTHRMGRERSTTPKERGGQAPPPTRKKKKKYRQKKGRNGIHHAIGERKRWEAPPRHPNKGWKEAALRKEVRRSNTLPNQGTGRNNTTQRKNRKRAPLTMRDGQSNTTPRRKEKAAPAQKGGAK